MEDKLLEKLFEHERWEKAISKGIAKDMSKADLRRLCDPNFRIAMYQSIRNGRYMIVPPHAQLIPKDKPGEFRTVYINENYDRVLLSLINDLLFEELPDMIHPVCKSYQTGIGCGKVVQECSRRISKANGTVIGWKSDLSKYFDSVPIEIIDALFDSIEKRTGYSAVIDLLRGYYHQNLCFDTDGNLVQKYMSLMQGCAVAAFLADACLYDMDDRMSKLGGFYVRYSDDCLYIGRNYFEAMEITKKMLGEKGLTLNPKKVEYLDANHWFKFLGFSIRGSEISISSNRLKKFTKEIKSRTIDNRNISYKAAIRSVQRFMYYGDGTYSWATGVLPIINNQHDLMEMNNWIMDCLRAVKRNRRKIGGLGYVKDGKEGVIVRGTGRNVKANRNETEQVIDGYHSLMEMRNALIYTRPLYDTIVRCEL